MSKESFFIGAPIVFKPGISIYPPKVSQVVDNDLFTIFSRLLTYSQEEVEDEFLEANKQLETYPSPIEFMLNNCYHSKKYELLCKKAFYFFIHEEVTFLYDQKLIIIGSAQHILKNINSLDELITLNEKEFFNFQNLIRESIGKKAIEPPIQGEDPRIAQIKRKARYRDKIKAKQAAKSKDGIDFYTMLVSICCMGIGITPLNIGEMSYAAIEAVLRKYQQKEKYQVDIDSLMAGADSKKVKPKYWIRNFED